MKEISFDRPSKMSFRLLKELDQLTKKQVEIVNEILTAKKIKREEKLGIEESFSGKLREIDLFDSKISKLTTENDVNKIIDHCNFLIDFIDNTGFDQGVGEERGKLLELLKHFKIYFQFYIYYSKKVPGQNIADNPTFQKGRKDKVTAIYPYKNKNKYIESIKKLNELDYIKKRLELENKQVYRYNKILLEFSLAFCSQKLKSFLEISEENERFYPLVGENLYRKKRILGDHPLGAVELKLFEKNSQEQKKEIEEYNHYVCDKYGNYIKRYQFRAISFRERMILSENPHEDIYTIRPADYGKNFGDLEGNTKEKKLRTIELIDNVTPDRISNLLTEELGEFSLNRIGHKRLIAVSPAFNKYIIRSNALSPFINDGGSLFDKDKFLCVNSSNSKNYFSQGGGIIKIDLSEISKGDIRSQYTMISFKNMEDKLKSVVGSINMRGGYESNIDEEISGAKKSAYRNREIHLINLPIKSIIGWKPYAEFPLWLEKQYISSPLIKDNTLKGKIEFYQYNIFITQKISAIAQVYINPSEVEIYLLDNVNKISTLDLIENIKTVSFQKYPELKSKLIKLFQEYHMIEDGLYLSLNNIAKYMNQKGSSEFNRLYDLLGAYIAFSFLPGDVSKKHLHVNLDIKNRKNKKLSPETSIQSSNIDSYKDKKTSINSDDLKLSLETLVDAFNVIVEYWLLGLNLNIEDINSILADSSMTDMLNSKSRIELLPVPDSNNVGRDSEALLENNTLELPLAYSANAEKVGFFRQSKLSPPAAGHGKSNAEFYAHIQPKIGN